MARKIRYEFVGDTSQLDRSLKNLEGEAGSLGVQFKKTFEKDGADGLVKMGKDAIKAHPYLAALATAAVAIGVAMVKAVAETIELGVRADEVAKKAKQIGSSAEDIQVLSGALAMGGVDASTAEAAMAKLNLRLAEAAAGGGPAVDVLKELGLSAKELQELPLPERFATLADRMETLDTQGKKTAAAVKLMEEGGIRLLSAFEGGGDAIRSSSEKIREAGVISNQTAREGEGLSDSIALMTRKFDNLKTGALAPLIPVVATTIDKIGEMLSLMAESWVFKSLAASVAFVAEKFLGLTHEVEAFKKSTSAMAQATSTSDKFIIKYTESTKAFQEELAAGEKRIKALNKEIKHMGALGRDTARYEKELETVEAGLKITREKLAADTKALNQWEADRARKARKSSDEVKALQEAEKDLAKKREEEEEAAEQRQARAEKRADDRRANREEAVKATEEWATATKDAEIARLEGIARLDAEHDRAYQAEAKRGDDILDKAGLSTEKQEALGEALVQRLEAIDREYAQKKMDLMDELLEAEEVRQDTEVEKARQAALAKADADFKYWQSVQENSKTDSEKKAEKYEADMEVVAEWTQQITQMHDQLWNVIEQAAQAAFDEWADAYGETADKIADIDEQLQGELSRGRRKQLEEEKARLEEQAAMEKEEALQAFERQKALAIVNATISTALAAINALATAPNIVVGIVLAALATAAGVASIAAIASQQPPQLHAGGMVPALEGSAGASDEVLIRARRGEAVLSPQGVNAAGGEPGVAALNRGGQPGAGGTTVNLIRVGARTTEAIMHDTLRVPSSNLSRALGGVRPRVGRHDPRSRKV